MYFSSQVKHAKRAYGSQSRSISAVAPMQSIANILYFNLERFAHVIVGMSQRITSSLQTLNHLCSFTNVVEILCSEVPNDGTNAVVKVVENPARPSWWRYVNHLHQLREPAAFEACQTKGGIAECLYSHASLF